VIGFDNSSGKVAAGRRTTEVARSPAAVVRCLGALCAAACDGDRHTRSG
jgi:hypothetical protein